LTNQQRLPRNTCKTELQPLIFQNKSQINIFFTLATTLLLPYMSCFEKTRSQDIPISQPSLYNAAGVRQLFCCICNMFRHSFMKGFE
jgi:hypothetical protein